VAWKKSIPLTVTYRGDNTSDYTVAAGDDVVIINDSQDFDDKTVTLPAASSNSGRKLTIKQGYDHAAYVVIDGNSSETIDGSSTLTLQGQNYAITIVCDGSNWHVVSESAGSAAY
jgi:hypothetical protein